MPKPPRVESQWKAERERLASELHRLEEALSDAREESGGEDEGSLVARLREATRKRVRIEEEFERSSDRWRDERRNLNAEIDRLDRALQKAQTEARRNRSSEIASDTKLQSELAEALRRRNELQSMLEEERGRWETDRHALEAKVADLESGLVDALDRANNLSRADKVRDATLRTEFEDQKRGIEDKVRARFEQSLDQAQAKIRELEDERGRLHLEIHRLKSEVPEVGEIAAEPASAPPADSGKLSLKDRLRGRWRASDGGDNSSETDVAHQAVAALRDQLGRQTAIAEEAASRQEAAEAQSTALQERCTALEARIADLEAGTHTATSGGASADVTNLEGRLRETEVSRDSLQSQLADESGAWSREREELQAKIGSLEASLAEAETGQEASARQIREGATRLTEAQETISRLEAQVGSQTELSGERDALLGKISGLEHALEEAQSNYNDLNSQYQQLLDEFEEVRRQGNEFLSQMDPESRALIEERNALTAEVRQLNDKLRQAEEAREAQESDGAAIQATLDRLTSELEASEERFAAASDQWEADKARLGETAATLGRELEEARRAAGSEREKLEAEIARSAGSYSTRIQELEASLTRAASEHQQAGQSVAEAESKSVELENELRARSEAWAKDRTELESVVAGLREELEKLRESADADGPPAAEGAGSAAQRGMASFGRVLSSLGGSGGEAGGSVADLEERRQLLELRLVESEESRSTLAEQLQSATEDWEAERGRLEAQLAEMNTALETADAREHAELDQQHAELRARLQEAETRYTNLEESSMAAAGAWDDQRTQLEQEISQWQQQVAAEAERVAEETRQALAEEYEKQLRELRSQKELLEAQLESGTSAAPAAGPPTDPKAVAEEIARVDAEIDEINRLIDDPNAALSNVMRKNAERSELKAYRRGLAYLAERFGKGSDLSTSGE